MFVPHYFILSDVIVNGIVSLISLSDTLWLVQRNTKDFLLIYTLQLFPSSLKSSSSFPVASLGFSVYSNTSSTKSGNFTSSFLIWIPSISFLCLLAVARTSNTMLTKHSENGHPVLFQILAGKLSVFLH